MQITPRLSQHVISLFPQFIASLANSQPSTVALWEATRPGGFYRYKYVGRSAVPVEDSAVTVQLLEEASRHTQVVCADLRAVTALPRHTIVCAGKGYVQTERELGMQCVADCTHAYSQHLPRSTRLSMELDSEFGSNLVFTADAGTPAALALEAADNNSFNLESIYVLHLSSDRVWQPVVFFRTAFEVCAGDRLLMPVNTPCLSLWRCAWSE